MIVKNEEGLLDQCLSSVSGCVDEINIIDTGSVDKTKEIAKRYTTRIFDFKWIDDFAAARNFSFEKATKDYILWLDADDILLKSDQEKLLKLKKELTGIEECVTFKYHYAVDKENNPLFIFRRERLVRRDKGFKWVGFVHEYIEGAKQILDADIAVTHKRTHGESDRNLKLYQKKLKEGIVFSNRDKYYYGKELYYHQLFKEAIVQLEPLVQQAIWFEEKIDCVCKLADCYGALKKEERGRALLLKAFEWTDPRAEVIYKLGQSYEREGKYLQAIYWYKSIEGAVLPLACQGFIYKDMWTWRPYLQIGVCYCHMGEYEKAFSYHQKAKSIKPDDPCILQNDQFFKRMGFKI